VTYLAGIHDLAYVFTRVGASADAGARQDWVGLGANIAGGIGKFIWYKKSHGILKDTLEKVGKKALPTPTAIIDVTMVCVVIVDLLNGFGPPEDGSKFAAGVDKLKVVDAKLELAVPDSRDWNGAAADAYNEQLATLRALVAEMQELDNRMKTIVGNQGDQIFQAHRTLAILGFALVLSQGVALALYLIPLVGPEVSMLFQVVAALAAATTCVVQESLVLGNSFNHATDAEAVTADYISLGSRTELGGSFAKIKVPGAEETKVGSFTDISNSLSAFSAPPTVARLAGMAGADGSVFEERRVLASAVTADGLSEDSPLPVLATAADDTKPEGTPTSTTPTMAGLSVAKMSKDMAAPLNAVNQTMSQAMQGVQQIVSMAQQGGQDAGAAAEDSVMGIADEEPAVEESADEEAMLAQDAQDVDGTGAASGAEAGERAPVDVAASEAEPTAERGPQRVL
jgi:hypothetical protein